MEFEFTTVVVEWRGPAPFFYAVVPDAESEAIHDMAAALTYGWGCIPVEAWLAGTWFTTSLFPKDGHYLVPLKAAVRPAGVGAGARVDLRMRLSVRG